MKILVTGAKGFVGRNLCAQLNNIRDGKARCYGDLQIDKVYEYDLDSAPEQLEEWCRECDFVFNLAGVNRPKPARHFEKVRQQGSRDAFQQRPGFPCRTFRQQ